MTPMLTDEQLASLLDDYHAADEDARPALEDALLRAISEHFNRELRPALARKFRGRTAADTSIRYTQMVHDFFVQVLDRRDDRFWRAKSLRALRSFASKVIQHRILDVLRRQRHRSDLGEEGLGEQLDDQALGELAHDRAAHFWTQHGLDYERVLQCLERWQARGGKQRRWAAVIRHRYVDGMPYEQIAEQLEVRRKTVQNLKSQALVELRRELS